MVSRTRDNPPHETTLLRVYMWKRFLYRPSQSGPCMIIHNPYWIIKWEDIPLSLSFPRAFDRSGFCKVNSHFFDRNFYLIPQSRHFVMLSLLSGLPYLPRWDNSSPELSCPPRQLWVIHINGCLSFKTTQGKVTSPRVTRGRFVSGTRGA